MTALALPAEASLVHVVAIVALRAGQARWLGFARAVAARTGEAPVRARQCKVRLPVVIETPEVPARRVVAGGTLTAECPFMHILLRMTVPACLACQIVESGRQVTLLAAERAMPPEQRKGSQFVPESIVAAPCPLAVATLAFRHRATVHVILFMAATTAFRYGIFQRTSVTTGTGQRRMRPLQPIAGAVKMVESDLPAILVVAFRARAAIASPVHIVSRVTTLAGIRQFARLGCLDMAGRALESRMAPLKPETGRASMIKLAVSPPPGRMAAFAVTAIAALVFVVRRMATEARGFGSVVVPARVTGRAGRLRMRAREAEIGLRGVIKTRLTPGARDMTVLARLTELPAMGILVAPGAGIRRLAKFRAALVAPRTCQRLVATGEVKPGRSMVEDVRIQPGDVRLPPPVFDVTGSAWLTRHRCLAMQALPALSIVSNGFVTVQAQAIFG